MPFCYFILIILNLVWHNIFWNVITNWNSSKISNDCHGKNIWHSRCVLFLMAIFISSGQKGTVSYNHNFASVRRPLFPINDISVHILIIFETTWVIETKHLWNYLSDWNQTSLKLLEWLKPNIFETTWVIVTKHLWNYLSNWNQHLWNYLSDWNRTSLKLLEWLKPNLFETTRVIEIKHLWNYLSVWNQTMYKWCMCMRERERERERAMELV